MWTGGVLRDSNEITGGGCREPGQTKRKRSQVVSDADTGHEILCTKETLIFTSARSLCFELCVCVCVCVSVCVCVPVCLSACLFLCLSPGYLKTYCTDFHESLWNVDH